MLQPTTAQQVFNQMNEMGAKQCPFIFIIDFKLEYAYISPLPLSANNLLYQCGSASNYETPNNIAPKPISFKKTPCDIQQYNKGFQQITQLLNKNELSFINYTQPTCIETNYSLKDIFMYTKAPYKLWVENKFVCFSPEIFVQIKNGKIFTNPMKGTIDASVPNAEHEILNNPKEIAEHKNCVNLLCNDLKAVATNVTIDKFRYIDRIKSNQKTLLQVSSQISGNLPANHLACLGDIIKALLPGGSILGAPKQKALEVINTIEGYDRNFYTGVFGIFDGQMLDSGVLIRFIEQTDKGLVYKSGGGITVDSVLENEYQEMIDKVYVPIY